MINSLRSLMILSFTLGFSGFFLFLLVLVMIEPRPSFTKIPEPTAFLAEAPVG